MGNPRLSDMLRSVVTPALTNKRAAFAFAGERIEELLDLNDMVERGTIAAVVDRVYPASRAADAHRRVETEARLGGVVIALAFDHEAAPRVDTGPAPGTASDELKRA